VGSKRDEPETVRVAVLAERVEHIRNDQVQIRSDVADFRTDTKDRFDSLDAKMDANRTRQIVQLCGLVIAMVLFVANLLTGRL